jgi:hypothetical protein
MELLYRLVVGRLLRVEEIAQVGDRSGGVAVGCHDSTALAGLRVRITPALAGWAGEFSVCGDPEMGRLPRPS